MNSGRMIGPIMIDFSNNGNAGQQHIPLLVQMDRKSFENCYSLELTY